MRVLVAAGVRARWRTLAALTLVTALACGFVLTAATGARRTGSSWARLRDATLAPNALLNVAPRDLEEAYRLVSARDDVAAFGGASWFPGFVEGNDAASDVGLFGGLGPGFGYSVWRPLIDEGRIADPDKVDEITINREYAELVGVGVGDQVTLVGPPGFGVRQPVTVVGIHRSPLDIGVNGSNPSAYGTPAFMDRWFPAMEGAEGFDQLRLLVAVRFAPGTDATQALGELAAALPEGSGVVDEAGLDGESRQGLAAASTAYWLLTGAAALATVILLTLLVGRIMRTGAAPASLLAALGTTRRERTLALWLPVAVALVAGVLVSVGVTVLASPLVRTGVARVADPLAGGWVDGPTLALLALGLSSTLISGAAVGAARAVRVLGPAPQVRTSRLARALDWSPSARMGTVAAFGGARPPARRLARTTLLGTGLALGGVVAATSWNASIDALQDTPRLQGWSFDAAVFDDAATRSDHREELAAALGEDDTVRGLADIRQVDLGFRGIDIDVFAITDRKGSIPLVMARGRPPAGRYEAAAGELFLRQAGYELGDEIELSGPNGTVRLTLVGETVFPFFGNTAFGLDVLTSSEALAELSPPLNTGFLVDLVPGASLEPIVALAGDEFEVDPPFSPPNIVRLNDASGVVGALTLFLGGFAVIVFAFGLFAAGSHQHAEYAVARAIGFRRRQVAAAFGWHAALLLGACVVWAVPVGIAAGRGVWSATARDLPVLDAFTVSASRLGLVAGLSVLTAGVVAIVSGIVPTRRPIAALLRTE